MLHLAPLLVALLTLPFPEKGALVPVSLGIAEDTDDDDSAALSEHVAALRQAVCQSSRHVRLVKDPATAAVRFEVEVYEVTPSGGGGERHHIKGRFYLHGKWEPFQSWAGGASSSPSGLGRFVEGAIFDGAAVERERLGERDAHGRYVPRSPADVARCIAEQ